MTRPTMSLVCVVLVVLFGLSLGWGNGDKDLYENDVCNNMSPPWRCKKIEACPAVLASVKGDVPPKICSFEDNAVIVCCPPDGSQNEDRVSPIPTSVTRPVTQQVTKPIMRPTPTSITNRPGQMKSKIMCEKYAEAVFQVSKPTLSLWGKPEKFDLCNRLETPLIVGGEKAKPREFPHMAQVGHGRKKASIDWLCGGSLISERYILSAAHCTAPKGWGVARWARLGDLDTNTDKDDARPEVFEIVARTNHPNYKSSSLYNDIALYKLNKDVTFSAYIRPICLQTEFDVPELAVATGWGRTMWGGRASKDLLKVRLNLVTTQKCNTSFHEFVGSQLPDGIVAASMLCAGDQEGKDTCQGDSGGPLQIALKEPYCMYAQIGVTSFGKECGSKHYPGVYTRVSHFRPWIESIVWP